MGGPAPCGRRRALRFTRFARAHSNPCRDGTSGRCRHIPFWHGVTGTHPDARRASLPIPAVLTDCRLRGHHHRKSSPHRAPRQGRGCGFRQPAAGGMVTGRLRQARGKMGGGGDCNKMGACSSAAHLPHFFVFQCAHHSVADDRRQRNLHRPTSKYHHPSRPRPVETHSQ